VHGQKNDQVLLSVCPAYYEQLTYSRSAGANRQQRGIWTCDWVIWL